MLLAVLPLTTVPTVVRFAGVLPESLSFAFLGASYIKAAIRPIESPATFDGIPPEIPLKSEPTGLPYIHTLAFHEAICQLTIVGISINKNEMSLSGESLKVEQISGGKCNIALPLFVYSGGELDREKLHFEIEYDGYDNLGGDVIILRLWLSIRFIKMSTCNLEQWDNNIYYMRMSTVSQCSPASLSTIFSHAAALGWQVLDLQSMIHIRSDVDLQEITQLSAFYMTIIEKLNALQDEREKYFSFKMQKLMAEPFVTRLFNKENEKGDKADKKHRLDHKRKMIEQRLQQQSEKHNHRAVLQMTLKAQQQKEKKIKEKIDQVCQQHQKRLAARIKKRKQQHSPNVSQDFSISEISSPTKSNDLPSSSKSIQNRQTISWAYEQNQKNGQSNADSNRFSNADNNRFSNADNNRLSIEPRPAEWHEEDHRDISHLSNPLYLSRLKREIELQQQQEKDMAKAFKGVNFRQHER